MTLHAHAYAHYSLRRNTEEPFPCLPDGSGRSEFLKQFKRIRSRLPQPLGAAATRVFVTLAEATDPRDWVNPERDPVCYVNQEEMANRCDMSPSRLRAYQAELAQAGWIEKRPLGNGHRRSRSRSGISFSPAIARFAEITSIFEAVEEERITMRNLRDTRSAHARLLRKQVAELIELYGADNPDVAFLLEAISDFPRADALQRLGITALQKHIDEVINLCRQSFDLLSIPEIPSGQPLKTERPYIQITTEETHLVTCNASASKRNTVKPVYSNPENPPPNSGEFDKEKNDVCCGAQRNTEFLEKLGPERLYALASEDFKLHLDIAQAKRPNRKIDFIDFMEAALGRLPELGINISAWHEAVQTMGEGSAAMCILILDANRDRPGFAVSNPGGYLRGMTRAAASGELNIIGSLIGLNERRKMVV